ncbi:hypothetical protein BJ878DRAFT_584566 [Calycina marina]|uniref:Heterokaryon incompatibility domain-containing protein n=1 Tax=Calycina marina TaxID=1763456 RepID=A0A9P7YWN0_9HELO|nr:hypothetical protein BJ878DRAFT_584566 [Calycina marina]
MGLLQQHDTGTFNLTKDHVGNDLISPSALLSHSWKDGQQVMFQDLEECSCEGKRGYDKIFFCAERAMRDGLKFIWVETCCIDKSKQSEIPREINAIFHCFWGLRIRRSRWFTKGWTLQGLLAPTSVELFLSKDKHNSEYMRLGNKYSSRQQVCVITGIPHSAFEGSGMTRFNVEERFMWSERREITKPEDKVYSLLDVFNVEIPLYYDEKPSRAYHWLREMIDRRLTCIQDLCDSDPRLDKKRIEDTKSHDL